MLRRFPRRLRRKLTMSFPSEAIRLGACASITSTGSGLSRRELSVQQENDLIIQYESFLRKKV